MAKGKKLKSGKNVSSSNLKKSKSAALAKTSLDFFIEKLWRDVEHKLRVEIWGPEDALRVQMKKKLTKKEKAYQALQRAEQLKNAVEQERLRLIAEAKRRDEEERKAAIEKEIRDQHEQGLRIEQLSATFKAIKKLRNSFRMNEQKDLEEAKWKEYLKCDGLPDPSDCGQMNTYLHLWDENKDRVTVKSCAGRTEEALQLLQSLDDFLDCPVVSQRQKEGWLSVRHGFRQLQKYNIDYCAYKLLRNIEDNLERTSIPTASYSTHKKSFTICLWVLIQLPIPIPNPKKPEPPRRTLEFPELQMNVVFPDSLKFWALCVRAMYVSYDHYSYLCATFEEPDVPEILKLDLLRTTQAEWDRCSEFKNKLAKQVSEAKPPKEAPDDETILLRSETAKPTASSMFVNYEDEMYAEARNALMTEVQPNVVNLRRYWIIGGVYNLDLLEQPPQPTELVFHETVVSSLRIPKWLREAPFYVQYTPPPAPEPGVTRKPEEIEADLKRQEQEYDKLIYVTLSLTNTVLWLDVPVVCQWDSERCVWMTEDVTDVKHNEEKQTIAFRTGRFGPFAMAMNKYCSMPYQAWELKPMADGKVIFTIMAAVLIVEFTLKGELVCVSQLQNAPNDALDGIIGVYYKLPKLKRLLQLGGVNVFPSADVFCYTEGVCEKQWPMERHLYFNMAQCCLFHNFSWSRWNLLAGRRKIVMQVREWPAAERAKLPNYLMLMITPLKALLVDCTEVSQTFNEDGLAKMSGKFYADLYHLIVNTASITVRRRLNDVSDELVNNVANILCATRIVSLS